MSTVNEKKEAEAFVHVEPYVPAKVSLPEITPKVIILGILLAIVLAASSTFVGLKIARTISGSIPAALISMMVLRRFRNSNILENNMVQTIASAGETVAAAIIFTLPALIILGFWDSFDYFQTALITVIGGVLGVMFSVPLRRSMVVKENLPYPEGLATAELLKAGEDVKGATKSLVVGSLFSATIAFLQTGFKVAGDTIQYWTKAGTAAFGASLYMSPVLMAAGYIVGMRGLIAFIVGGLLTWGIGIPLWVSLNGLPEAADLGAALAGIQKANFRYIGVGVLAVGGLWGVISLIPQIKAAISASFAAMKKKGGVFVNTPRTDRDLPFHYVIWVILGITIPTFLLFLSLIEAANFGLSPLMYWGTILFATIFSLLIGFVGSAVSAYVVGIIGTTSLPVSGIAIASIIAFASILLAILGSVIDFTVNTDAALKASAMVIVFAAFVCAAASLSGDNMQDLKAGQIVGSTPWKQQLMLAIGTIASAMVIPFILQTTFEAYGIGDILPRPGMDPNQALPAPQATLMATVAKGFFAGNLPWPMIQIGAGLAVLAIIVDEILKHGKSGYRFPPLLFALGIYLPFGYILGFFVGGLVNAMVVRSSKGHYDKSDTNTGVLFASGIIAGEAILGALLTIPFAYYQTTDVFALNIPWLQPYQNILGAVLYFLLCITLYKFALKKKSRKSR